MTKLEYLKQLEDALKNHVSQREIDEIIRDYAEYFAEGERQGKSEYETVRNLGTPQEVAQQILSEAMGDSPNTAKGKVKGIWKKVQASGIWSKIALLVLIFVLSPFLLTIGGIALAALGMAAMIFLSIFFSLLGGIVASFAIAVCGVMGMGVLPTSVIAMSLIAAVGVLAGSIFGICLCFMLIRWFYRGMKKRFQSKNRPMGIPMEGER